MSQRKKKALILAGSRGIGNAITKKLSKTCDVKSLSSNDCDTSDIEAMRNLAKKYKNVDILVLNTGGPPSKDFFEISQQEWDQAHNQLFLGFCILLQNIKINKNGYIFLISSHTIKNPEEKLVLSNSYRVALSSILKTVSKILSKDKISCINIAPGPIKTKRLKNLVYNVKKFEKTLPLGYAAHPNEIALFIKAIIENKIKYLNGVTINFDGGISPSLF